MPTCLPVADAPDFLAGTAASAKEGLDRNGTGGVVGPVGAVAGTETGVVLPFCASGETISLGGDGDGVATFVEIGTLVMAPNGATGAKVDVEPSVVVFDEGNSSSAPTGDGLVVGPVATVSAGVAIGATKVAGGTTTGGPVKEGEGVGGARMEGGYASMIGSP